MSDYFKAQEGIIYGMALGHYETEKFISNPFLRQFSSRFRAWNFSPIYRVESDHRRDCLLREFTTFYNVEIG
jgi:hypothetical protein